MMSNRMRSFHMQQKGCLMPEIMDWVKGRNQPEGGDPDDGDDDDNVISTCGSVGDSTTAADESEIIHTSTKFLCVIAQQKTCVL